jgi:hypothetical protein
MFSENETTNKTFKILSEEVENFVIEYANILEESGVFKGTQILFSNLIYKPKFLFIGINPGPGYFNHNNGEKVKRYIPLEKLEYIDENYDYTLAEESKDLFEKANCLNLLSNAMKTNCCFFSTTNEPELTILLKKIMHNGRPNIYREVEAWTKRIIEMVEPEIIICEGKSAFNKVAEKIFDQNKTWDDGYGYFKSNNNIHVLGYERSYSNIVDKGKVAIQLEELVANGS